MSTQIEPLASERAAAPAWRMWADRCTRGLLLGSSAAVLAVAVWFLFQAVPVDDDVVRAARPAQIGFFNYVIGFVYRHWQGRWASAGLESAVLPHVDLVHGYWTLIAAVAVVELSAIFVILRYGLRLPVRRATATTVIVAAYLWAGMPGPAEAIYWFVGAVENVLDLALATVVVLATSRARPTVPTAAVLGISAFVVCGFHELYGLMFCSVLALATMAAFHRQSLKRWLWTAVTISAAAGLLVVIAAPGNAERARSDGALHGMQFGYARQIFDGELLHLGKFWLLDPRLIAAAVLCACSTAGTEAVAKLRPFPWRWIVPAGTAVLVPLGLFIPTFVFGQWIPDRTASGIWLVFTAGVFTTILLWADSGRWFGPAPVRTVQGVARTALAILLLTTGNARTAWQDHRGNLHRWHSAVEDRFHLLQTTPGTHVALPPLPSGPHLLRTPELYRSGPAIYTRSWAFCFGKQSVTVDPPVDPPKPGQ